MSQRDAIQQRAPHLDAAWVEVFVVELRLRGASGKAIGAALLEVESHMADHGGDVTSAFGEASAYAASLEIPDTQRFTPTEMLLMGLCGGLFAFGLWLVASGIFAIATGSQAVLSIVVAGVLIILNFAAGVLLAKYSEPVLRAFVSHPLIAGLVVAVGVVAVVLAAELGTLAPSLAVEVPAPATLIVGFVLLGAALLWWWRGRQSGSLAADDVTFPVV